MSCTCASLLTIADIVAQHFWTADHGSNRRVVIIYGIKPMTPAQALFGAVHVVIT